MSPPGLQHSPVERHGAWREWIVFILVCVHLLFLPWSLGGMPLWSQQIGLGIAALAFLSGLTLRLTDPRLPVKELLKRILAHPPLWLGTALIGYIAIQTLNPAFRYVVIGDQFFMVPLEFIQWLPFGVDAPLEQMNPLRHLIIVSGTVLSIVTIGLFLNRRKSIRTLFVLLSLNGLLLAAVGFAQLFLEADKILWTYQPSHERFYGSFIYRNHAAAYLNVVFAVSVGLYFFYRERAWSVRRAMADVSPLFFFTALSVFTLSLFSQSRAGTVIAVILLLVSGLFSLVHGVRWGRLREATVVSGIYVALFAAFIATFIGVLGLERITERFARLAEGEADRSMETRMTAYEATWEMYQDNWLWGWGAGSFEYLFPSYQENYPEIHVNHAGERMIWEYAHNDPLQYLTEYGLAGMSLVFLLGAYWAWQFVQRGAWRRPLLVFAMIAGISPLVHSLVDFPLQNPAVLLTAGACFALATRYLQLDDPGHGDARMITGPEKPPPEDEDRLR